MNKPTVLRWFAGLLFLALLTGCMTGPNYKRPQTPVPETWSQEAPARTAADPVALSEWWKVFEDEILTEFVQEAAQENLDLKTAFMRIEEAAAVRGIARGEYWPAVDGVGSAASTRLSDLAGGDLAQERNVDVYSVGLDASWEMDLWGRIRRSVQAADASLQASIEDYRDTLVILYAQIAGSYLDLREIQMRIRLLKENITNQTDTLRLTRGRYDAGLVPALDVHQAELNLSRTESALPLLRQGLALATHRLAVLTGRAPGDLAVRLDERDEVPLPDFTVLTGIPADLLRQRPDVRRAEQELIARTARIGVARADLLPRISLSGSFALEAAEAGNLGNSGSQAYRFGPSFRWALFQGGRIRSNIKAEEARAEQAMFQYQQSVLLALEDVENAFVSFAQERDRLDFIRASVEAASKSVSQVRSLYENGLVNFLNVLDAERSLAEQQDLLALSAGQLSRNIVGIYRSLGGGWDASEAEVESEDGGEAEGVETARETLAEHDTIARFNGISYRECMGLTALCPDRCGHSGDFAEFTILEYKFYSKPGEYGEPMAEEWSFQIDDNMGHRKVADDIYQTVTALDAGDRVRLAWKHDYVTRGSVTGPERIVTRLESIKP